MHRYQVKGRVVSVDKTQNRVVIDHQAIPGFMEAMTMPYAVKEQRSLEGLARGDQIVAELVVMKDSAWLDTIVVTRKAGEKSPPSTSDFHMPQKGEQVPGFIFVNQNGKKIRFHQYEGKSVLLTFIYTRCPLPDYCPRMTDNFAAIEQTLAKDPQSYSRTHLLSISFDPKYDTPEVLRAYAEKHVPQTSTRRSEQHWEFAVTPQSEIKEIAQFFGLTFSEQNGQIIHSVSTAIISPDGKIYAWYYGNTWKPDDVLKDLKDSLSEGRRVEG